jgi:murein L,D-transpeptidase YafK
MSVGRRQCSVMRMAAVGAFLLAGAIDRAAALTIELKDVAEDRVERQRAFAEGRLPLPGTPNLGDLESRLAAAGLKAGAPMFIRILKAESLLEIWMLKGDKFVLFTSYPICHWSGTLGPKSREGDRQNPEGFYSITQRQLHRIGRWPRSLNLGFPNNYDRLFGRTGSYILVHGGCSSTGCFAMTNAVIEEIYNLTERSLRAGQERVHVHVYPFRLTQESLDRHRKSEWYDFWANLKEGFDAFEETRIPPRISVCDNRYLVQNVLRHNGPEEVADPGPLSVMRRAARRDTPGGESELDCGKGSQVVASAPLERTDEPVAAPRKPRQRGETAASGRDDDAGKAARTRRRAAHPTEPAVRPLAPELPEVVFAPGRSG